MQTGGAGGEGDLGVKRGGVSGVASPKPLAMAAGRWASAGCILGSYDIIGGKAKSRGRPGGYEAKIMVAEVPRGAKPGTRKIMVVEVPIEARKPGTRENHGLRGR
jgi:hypothetical protein